MIEGENIHFEKYSEMDLIPLKELASQIKTKAF
jgi:hypothetical protein